MRLLWHNRRMALPETISPRAGDTGHADTRSAGPAPGTHGGRVVHHRYEDPLDHIWLETARRIGLRIERTPHAYASTDGAGTLFVGTPETLDADDCLAQMVFHELCHSLVEGPDAFTRPDWGLDNTGPRDVVREHACLRLQAVLAGEHGLRRLLAPTTDFRGFYDRLGADPLMPRGVPSTVLAIQGLHRAERPPWAPHLDAALRATTAIAQQTAAFSSPRPPTGEHGAPALPRLWELVEPVPERHPAGFPAAPAPAPEALRSSGPDPGRPEPARTCGTCAWRYRGGPGRPVDRCRQARNARVTATWDACNRWEPVLDCQDCGACCREAYDSVTVSGRDPVIRRHPELVVHRSTYLELARHESRCAALEPLAAAQVGNTDVTRYGCRIYEHRPRTCREFERSGPHCLVARRRVGLSR